MDLQPIQVEPLDDLHLLITFQNGEKKVFDVLPCSLAPVRQPLKNKSFFQSTEATKENPDCYEFARESDIN